jgi:hypothetical protein
MPLLLHLRIAALFTGKKVIQLFPEQGSAADRHGSPFYTLMDKKLLKRDAQVSVHVYPFSKVGQVTLFPGGTVSYQSESCYIKGWKYV